MSCRNLEGDSSEESVNELHIANQIQFAYVFVRAAETAYSLGNVIAGNKTQALAKAALLEARRFQDELTPKRKVSFAIELDALQSALEQLARLTDPG